MVRTNVNRIRKFFLYSDKEDKSTCNLGECKAVIKGNHASNLERHIKRFHDVEYKKFQKEKMNACKQRTNEVSSSEPHEKRTCPADQRCIDEMLSKTIRVKINEETLENACLELVTINGRPFALMDDSGFRKVLDPLLEGMRSKFIINAKNIRDKIEEKAIIVRNRIKQEMEGKLVSLKADVATCRDRSVLGVNLQFIKDGKVELRTLAMKELKDSHTGLYLKNVLEEIIEQYGIKNDQIYSLTTDNGANMLKCVRLISEEDVGEKNSCVEQPSCSSWQSDVELSSDEEDSVTDYNCINVEVFLGEFSNSSFSSATQTRYAWKGVRCAAHTLQLAVEDALKESSLREVINSARSICKKLRNSSVCVLLKKLKLKKPILDTPTRWHSTYDMLQRLLLLKDFCLDMAASNVNFHLPQNTWNTFSTLVAVLEPAKIATKSLQHEQLTFGDFFGIWLNCKLKITKLTSTSSPLAQLLLSAMEKRETQLFKNDLFVASIYLDPRYKMFLSEIEQVVATQHLQQTWDRMKLLQQEPASNSLVTETDSPETSSTDDDLDLLIKAKDRVAEQHRHSFASTVFTTNNAAVQRSSIMVLLNSFANVPRLPKNENVLKYWEQLKETKQELHQLSQIVLAVPATQVSVERSFSGLKYILSPLRTNMSEKVLEDILLIRSNSLFQK